MNDAATKTCSKCGEVKAAILFSSRGNICRACKRESVRVWRIKNIEKVRATEKKWKEKNKEKVGRWARENPEKVRAINKKWYAANKEFCRVMQKRWTLRNRDKVRAYKKKNSKKYSDELADSYVRNFLSNVLQVPQRLITEDLIEVKRKHLQLVRKLKEMDDER